MLPIIRNLNASERDLVGRTWARRAEACARKQLRFAALAPAVTAHGAPKGIGDLCQRAANDAQQHITQCVTVAESFGVSPNLEDIARPGPLAPPTLHIDRRILYEMVAISCIDETLSGAMMGQVYQRAKYPPIRLAAHMMFSDGVWHSRAGWGYLGSVQKEQSVGWLAMYLIDLLERTSEHEIRRPEGSQRPPRYLEDYGELSHEVRTTTFKEVANTVVLPGLESYGVDISQGRAWCRAWVEKRRKIEAEKP